mmetsp:Transcript_6775/g.8192  ORF Transcript_6775/g.8192 Transcript_6775/m.8192 type:complete len:343 (-) Transcript_6775:1349-2377(-)
MNSESTFPNDARASCARFISSGTLASVDQAACKKFAEELDIVKVRELGSTLVLDNNLTKVSVVFPSVKSEAGFITLEHALDFGGGWRKELHAFHGKGAWNTVKPGIEELYRRNSDLQGDWLANLSEKDVEDAFALQGAVSLKGLVNGLRTVANEVGSKVKEIGHETVGDFIITEVERLASDQNPAAKLVESLVTNFPLTFRDQYEVNGHSVCLFKKAQLVVGELYHRFRNEDSRFNFKDGDELTAFIDNVICAVMRKVGIVKVSESVENRINSYEPLPKGSEAEVSLRAAAMVGVEETVRIVNASGNTLTSVELGNYLWGILGKTPDFRKYTRHVTKDTVFY